MNTLTPSSSTGWAFYSSHQVSHFKKVWDSYCDLWLKCKRVVVVVVVVVAVVIVVVVVVVQW